MPGPLDGVRILEVVGLGPGPFAAMLLADLGAEVLRVDRIREDAGHAQPEFDFLSRSRRSAALDLKRPEGRDALLRMVERADGLIEGFRPGVMERLGLGPDACRARNPRLVYGRMTGWGREGPLAPAAGHDINYVALAGSLHPIGREGQAPTPPLNLVADFGGGGMLLAFGMLAALLERERSSEGQVVDAAMVDGVALLTTAIHGAQQSGFWTEERGENLLDTGAPFYEVYETADGRYVAVGAIEPQFHAELCRLLEIDPAELPHQLDRARWPETKERFAKIFRSRTRDEWCARMEGSDACFAPVLSLSEARAHPQNQAREVFVKVGKALHPAPAPRFSRTRPASPTVPLAARPAHRRGARGVGAVRGRDPGAPRARRRGLTRRARGRKRRRGREARCRLGSRARWRS